MAQVAVTINGRNYRIACEDGQEEHLIRLSGYLNGKVEELVRAVGQIGDTRLLVMAGLLIADELSDAKAGEETARKIAEEARAVDIGAGSAADPVVEDAVAAQIDTLAERIDDIAAGLSRH